MPLDVSRAPTSASPLWVIALFIALSEATAGVAAITTNGTARLIFACFAVAFPTVVFVVFVWLLVKYAPNLYAPGQYSREITPEVYRIGISRADSIFLGRAVAESVAPLLRGTDEGEAHDALVDQVADRFEAAVEESSVTVVLAPPLKPSTEVVQIPVTKSTKIDSLLDSIYSRLQPAVRPFTYNLSWTLIDKNGTKYSDMGTDWARERDLISDTRPITAVGIGPGSHLTAVVKKRGNRQNLFSQSFTGHRQPSVRETS